jgi:hypothetical protein
MRLGLREIKALYPNDPSAKRSTLKVSLGTGKALDDDPWMHGSGSWWSDLWLFRLCRALWSSMDGQGGEEAAHDQGPGQDNLKSGTRGRRRGEYYRFNVEFGGGEPRLDDPIKIPEMKIRAREAILQSPEANRLALCCIAKLFVFELESVPRKENGRYPCTGYILSCRRAGPSLEALLGRLTRNSAKFLLRGRALPGSMRDRSSLARDGNFRKRVCFDVTSKQDLISLYLQEDGSEPFDISGSPFSIDWLEEAQGLGQPFSRKRKGSDEGPPRKRPRL